MEVVYSRCAGLDVHKKLIVACVRLIDSGRIVRQKERFGTTSAELMRLSALMTAQKVTHAAMVAGSGALPIGSGADLRNKTKGRSDTP